MEITTKRPSRCSRTAGGFGEFDLSGGGRQKSSALAMTDCRVAVIRTSDLRLALECHPRLAVDLFSVFSETLRHSEQAIGILLHREVAGRLASLVPMLAERFGEDGGDGGEFTIPFTQSELAEMVACSREAVSKALGELGSEEFLKLERRNIKITDQSGLGLYAANNSVSLDSRGATRMPSSFCGT